MICNGEKFDLSGIIAAYKNAKFRPMKVIWRNCRLRERFETPRHCLYGLNVVEEGEGGGLLLIGSEQTLVTLYE